MGLESATTIQGLDASNPTGSDQKAQGDDHLRLIKAVLKSSFPNASKAFYFPTFESISANETVAGGDENKWYQADTSGGNIDVTLPTSLGTSRAGYKIIVQRGASAANTLTIAPASGTIDGAASLSIPGAYHAREFVWTGTAWTSGQLGALAYLDTVGTSQYAANSVTRAKMSQMAANGLIGNNTGAASDPIDLTPTEATAILDDMVGDSGSGGTKGLAPAPAANDADAGKLKLLGANAAWYRPTWHFISEINLSSGSSHDVTGLSGYDVIKIELSVELSADADVELRVGAGSIDTGGNYQYGMLGRLWSNSGDSSPTANPVSDDSFQLCHVPVESSVASFYSGSVTLYNFGTASYTNMLFRSIYPTGTNSGLVVMDGGGSYKVSSALDRLQILLSAGTFAAGTSFIIEGRKIN